MNVTLTLIGQMGTFAVLIWFVMKFLWNPILQVMDDRTTRISEGLAAAERGKREQEEAAEAVEVSMGLGITSNPSVGAVRPSLSITSRALARTARL